MGQPSLDQDSFGWFQDDNVASVDSATQIGSTNQDLSSPQLDTTYLFRTLLQNTGDKDEEQPFVLRYSLDDSTYVTVTTTSSYVRSVAASGSWSDGDSAGQLLGGGTYDEGYADQNDGNIASYVFGQGTESELVFAIQFRSADIGAETIYLQVWYATGPTALDSYTNTPATVFAAELICDAGSYSVTGRDPTLTHGYTLTCDAGSYSVTGQDPTLTVARQLPAEAGSYSVTGQDATLTAVDNVIGGMSVVTPSRVGPFAASDGDLFFIVQNNATDQEFSMMRSADGGATWAAVDESNKPAQTDLQNVDAQQVSDVLHIVCHDGSAVYYHTFNLATHAWGTTDTAVVTGISVTQESCAIVVEPSSGDMVVAYTRLNSGDSLDTAYFKIDNGGGFGSENVFIDTVDWHDRFVAGVFDPINNLALFALKTDDTASAFSRFEVVKLTYSGGWGTSVTRGLILSSNNLNGSQEYAAILPPVFFQNGSDGKVASTRKDADERLWFRRTTNGTDSSTFIAVYTGVVAENFGGSSAPVASATADSNIVYFFFSDAATNDIYYTYSVNFATASGTLTEFLDGVTCHSIRINAFRHSAANGSKNVIGIIWDAGGNGTAGYLRYAEYVLPLALDAGSYAITGQDATLAAGRQLSVDAGSYTITGYDVTLTIDRQLPVDAGSYAVTGQDPALVRDAALALEAGSYSVTGLAATLDYSQAEAATETIIRIYRPGLVMITFPMVVGGEAAAYSLPVDAGSYAITGYDVTLSVGRKLDLEAGSYAVSGQDATFTHGRTLTCDAGSYSVTGQDATFTRGRHLSLDAGSYSVTGQDATFTHGLHLALDAGSYAVSGQDPTLAVARQLALNAGSYAITGLDVGLAYSGEGAYEIACDLGVYTITGQDPTLVVARKLSLDAGSYTVTGQTTTLSKGFAIALEAGAYTVTGQDPTLSKGFVITLDAGSYAVSGQDPALTVARVLSLDAGSYTVVGQAAILDYSGEGAYEILCDLGVYTVAGQDVTFDRTYVLSLEAGVYSVSGQTTTLSYGRMLDVDAGSYSITGQDVDFVRDYTVFCDAGSYVVTGQDSTLTATRALSLDAGSYVITGQDPEISRGFSLALDAGSHIISGQTTTFVATRQLALGVGAYTYTGLDLTLDYSGATIQVYETQLLVNVSPTMSINSNPSPSAEQEAILIPGEEVMVG